MKNKLKNGLKIILIAVFIMPMILAFSGCSCSDGSSGTKNPNSNVVHTVRFYSGMPYKFEVPEQEIKDGGYVKKPVDFPLSYYNEDENRYYEYVGWYSDASCLDVFLWRFDSDQVHTSFWLYCKWRPKEV